MTTLPPNLFLTYYWAAIFAGFTFLWVVTLLAWHRHRDNRALVYMLLFLQLSAIAGISVIARANIFSGEIEHLIAIQRGLWGALLITSFAIVDIFNAVRRGKPARAYRMWLFIAQADSHRGSA